ncbi:MAG: hypothetical protein ABSD62_09920 [Candidatus Limnocylindrales bacterium]|jgi:hypothetical protein
MDQPSERRDIAARIGELRGMDGVDGYRLRLVALRTRVEANWPESGSLLRRRKGMDKDAEASIADLLVALPTPLPLVPGGEPKPIITDADTDLRAVAGRAVDAAMALLELGSTDAVYPGEVRMLESYRPGALDPITVSRPSVGLLLATIIGALEAIADRLAPRPPVMPAWGAAPKTGPPPARRTGPTVRP